MREGCWKGTRRVLEMAKLIFNPDKEVTIEDELIERKAMSYIMGFLKEIVENQVESKAEGCD